MRQNEGGEHGESIDDDLYIHKLEEDPHRIGGDLICLVLPRRKPFKGLPGQIEQVGGSDIPHHRLDAGNDSSKGAAEDAAHEHKGQRACPDPHHKLHIFSYTVAAGRGQQENVVGPRRPYGDTGREGHFPEYRQRHRKYPFLTRKSSAILSYPFCIIQSFLKPYVTIIKKTFIGYMEEIVYTLLCNTAMI